MRGGRRAGGRLRSTAGDHGAYVTQLACEALESRQLLTALDDYVAAFDPNYHYSLVATTPGPNFTHYLIDMTSQQWRTAQEVDKPIWQHWVEIVVPTTALPGTAVLVVSGGNNDHTTPPPVTPELVQAALAANMVLVHVPTIPSEPLQFADENFTRSEDAIIAYTFDKFIDTGDPTWPALLPMVKSAVRGMDTAQDFLSHLPIPRPINDFIVTGASKRGWTTWLTAAVDERVRAIVPVVFDALNLDEQFVHQISVYGELGPALDDYVAADIPGRAFTPRGQELLSIVDPYEYRDRLTLPKLGINSTGDEFFVVDSAQFYFHDLVGDSYLRYFPNTGHGLNLPGGTVAAVTEALVPFVTSTILGTPRPQFTWTVQADDSILALVSTPPLEVRLWQATDVDGRDFRASQPNPPFWTMSVVSPIGLGTYLGSVQPPPGGGTAFFLEFVFPNLPGLPNYVFDTEIHVKTAPAAGNQTPKAGDDRAATAINQPIDINILANDTDDGPLGASSFIPVSGPYHGTFADVGGLLRYTPQAGYSGGDTFEYRLRDAEGALSNVASVQIRVGGAVAFSGQVFVDANGNNAFDLGEVGIPGARVHITGQSWPLAVDRVVVTDGNGNYSLTEADVPNLLLPAGTYSVTEIQPAAFHQGTTGTGYRIGPGNEILSTLPGADDRFGPYLIGAAQQAIQLNFAELGLRADFLAQIAGGTYFTASAGLGGLVLPAGGSSQDINLAQGPVWFALDGGWVGPLSVNATSNTLLGSAQVSLYDNQFRQLATSRTAGNAAITYPGSTTGPYFLKLEGTNSSVDLYVSAGAAVVPGPDAVETIGAFDPSTAMFYLRNTNGSGLPDFTPFPFGAPGWQAVYGDWDGNGSTTIGVFDPVNATFYLRNSNGSGPVNVAPFPFGGAGWQPLAGDWNGDGVDTVGVFNPNNGVFYLRNSNSAGAADGGTFLYGLPGWTAVTGDWNGDGTDTIGVFNPTQAAFYLRNANSTGPNDIPTFAFGASTFVPFVGDWNGDLIDTIGVFDPATARFFLRNTNNSGAADFPPFLYGAPNWRPLAGHWTAVTTVSGYSLDTPTSSATAGAALTPGQVGALLNEAAARWLAAGLNPAGAAQAALAQVQIVDLPGTQIARTVASQIFLDTTAAGNGWFVDASPQDDSEFAAAVAGQKQAQAGSAAATKIDLLTVLAHELGHVLGLEDTAANGTDLMADLLPVGVRRSPVAAQIDLLFGLDE
ncbi:MAG: hypothetical protein K1X74_07050 [Pirellulales bacterium]|nr:hypothetical protein [Pirellulales bacterium]